MVVRATFTIVRAASFLGALLVFLLSMVFLPGGVFGAGEPSLAASAAYSIGAGVGAFLLAFGWWTYRVQALVMRLAVARLLLFRTVLLGLVFLGAAVVAASLAWPVFARWGIATGAVASGVGLVVSFVVRGRPSRRRSVAKRDPTESV